MWNYLKILVVLLMSANAHAFWPEVTAKSWLVADGTGKVLQGSNTQEVRSIASISKLMTVMVVLDAGQDLTQRINLYSRKELIALALVKSDNHAAQLLCDNYRGGKTACISDMNSKANKLGMTDTKFVEPTGLSVFNVSTATDLIKLVLAAKDYAEINAAAKMSEIKIQIRKKWFIFHNTNPIIGKRHEFVVSKTGYIRASGGCIVMMLDTDIGQRIVVLLGSKDTRTRIPEAEFIATQF